VTEQTLLWSSLALRVHEFGWRPYWATLALSGYQLFLLAPLVGIARARDRAGAGTAAAPLTVAVTALTSENT
jgi:hypothetical protein